MVTTGKKICFFISDVSACGGTERVCLKIASELSHRGYEIHIVSLLTKKLPFFEFDNKIIFHTLLRSSIERILVHKQWYKRWKLNYLLNNIKADIVIDTTLGDIISQVVIPRPEKYISWIHFTYEFSIQYRPHIKSLQSIISKGGKMVVLTNADMNSYIKYGIPANRIKIIHNPLTFDTTPTNKERNNTVIAVGRFAEEKGFDLLLRAWALVEMHDNNWSLEIWGDDGRYENDLPQLSRRLGLKRVSLNGTTKDIQKVLQKGSIYALSSRHESFGLVLLEAAACGLPLISFDCPNGPREIIEDGKSGVLIQRENIVEFANAILDLINNKHRRLELGDAAFEMSKGYSIEKVADEWECLFAEL